jgi:hypothetical protein
MNGQVLQKFSGRVCGCKSRNDLVKAESHHWVGRVVMQAADEEGGGGTGIQAEEGGGGTGYQWVQVVPMEWCVLRGMFLASWPGSFGLSRRTRTLASSHTTYYNHNR